MKAFFLILAIVALPAAAEPQALRDPFARPVTNAVLAAAQAPVAPPAPPRLRAVMYDPGKSLVNIDGRILAVGDSLTDSVDNYRVIAIGAGSATLIRRGVKTVIVLDEESSK